MVSELGRITVTTRKKSIGQDTVFREILPLDRGGLDRSVPRVEEEIEKIERDSRDNLQE